MARHSSLLKWSALAVGLTGAFCMVPLVRTTSGGESAAVRFKHASEAPALVQAALDAELAGDAEKRAELLAEALKADPEYAPAHWQSGEVLFNGQWRAPSDVQELVAHHPRWTEYRKLRDSLGNAPEDHLTLAEFCSEHQLANEARYHWANVLLAWPQNAEARKGLCLEEYRGRLFTHEQVVKSEQEAKDAKKISAQLKPKMRALCRDAVCGDETRREAALAQLRAIDDLSAIPALEWAVDRAAAKTPRYALALQKAFVAALANMPQHDATLRLLNIAVFCPLEPLRLSAAEALAARPQTDYVPLLMAALTAPVEVQFDLIAAPDGTVRMSETLFQQNAESAARHVHSVNYETEGVMNYDPNRENPAAVLASNLSSAAEIAADAQEQVDAANAQAEQWNARIEAVLKVTSKYEADADATKWWEAWKAHNELQYAETPVYESTSQQTFVYSYEQMPIPGLVAAPEGVGHGACFKAGTPVWTQGGPVPIEKIAVGDMVLSQSPQTGEVSYRAVLGTTLGRPTRVLRMQFENESIVATLGHRFWAEGRGWAMAKSLEPGAAVRALDGAVMLESANEDREVACHNLVVDEFHTYFVGETKLLVHDIGCPLPVIAAVPGSERLRSEPLDPPMSLEASGW